MGSKAWGKDQGFGPRHVLRCLLYIQVELSSRQVEQSLGIWSWGERYIGWRYKISSHQHNDVLNSSKPLGLMIYHKWECKSGRGCIISDSYKSGFEVVMGVSLDWS